MIFETDSVEATYALGRRLGACLTAGDLVALVGPLGSGKTTFVKGVAGGAQVSDLRQVNSPTFVIVNEYDGSSAGLPLRLFHIDAYRLRGAADLEALGFDEMAVRGAVLLEWADRVAGVLPADRLTLTLEPLDATRRRFIATAAGIRSERLLASLASTAD